MISFMKYKSLYLIISALVILPGITSLIAFGLRPSIDFTGGSLLELRVDSLKQATSPAAVKSQDSGKPQSLEAYAKPVRDYLDSQKLDFEEVRSTVNGFLLRSKEIDETVKNKIVQGISSEVVPVSESRFETLGPVLGRELLFKTVVGVILAALFIAGYIVYQFKDLAFGLCATMATVHDSLVILGVFSLLGYFARVEVDTLFVTAVLTVLSFSVHDTIVVYDRFREKMAHFQVKFSELTSLELEKVIDAATNETLVRSLNNSLTVIFMLVALFVLGGESIRWFALALLVGTVSGTYSSPFVAGPLLILFKNIQSRALRPAESQNDASQKMAD